jgi:cytidylate kinase
MTVLSLNYERNSIFLGCISAHAQEGDCVSTTLRRLKSVNTRVSKRARVRHADTQTRRHADTQTRRHADTQTRRYATGRYATGTHVRTHARPMRLIQAVCSTRLPGMTAAAASIVTGLPPQKIVLIGPPGSGKGTYAKLFAPKAGVPHLSTGDLLRSEVEANTTLGTEVVSCLLRGAS